MAALTLQWWHLALILALVVLGWALWRRAVRIDRLHLDVMRARHTLNHALNRRATLASNLATAGILDPAEAVVVADAAAACLDVDDAGLTTDLLEGEPPTDLAVSRTKGDQPGEQRPADPRTRAAIESDMTRVLRTVVTDPGTLQALNEQAPLMVDQLNDVGFRIQDARRFHNSRVSQARAVRGTLISKMFFLAGRAPLPEPIDLDDVTATQ